MAPLWIVSLLLSSALAAELTSPTREAETADPQAAEASGLMSEPASSLWNFGVYLDIGYSVDVNHPENGLWRSKSTTYKVDAPQLNMVMGYVRKDATPESRWGMELGLQDGVDSQGLIPSPPPEANAPVKHADQYRHLAFRPEWYWDPNGLMTGADQVIQAYTATLKYRLTPFGMGDLAVNLEYRHDRSTGQEGGFYCGSNNRLVPNQQLLILALTWAFGK
jgi:hypothetical protein